MYGDADPVMSIAPPLAASPLAMVKPAGSETGGEVCKTDTTWADSTSPHVASGRLISITCHRRGHSLCVEGEDVACPGRLNHGSPLTT